MVCIFSYFWFEKIMKYVTYLYITSQNHYNSHSRFVVYKYPKLKGSGNLFNSGVGYSFMTSNSFSSWKLSTLSINNTNSIIGRTLYNLYNEQVRKWWNYIIKSVCISYFRINSLIFCTMINHPREHQMKRKVIIKVLF